MLLPQGVRSVHALIARAGNVVTRDDLMRDVWNTTFWTSSKTIDVHLGWVRRKLGDDPRTRTLITTIRGQGLRFETEAARGDSAESTGSLGCVRAVPPPRPLAVIGGGQLARMMAAARHRPRAAASAARRGRGVSAAQVIADHVVGDYRDLATLREVTRGCAVVTFDHEHVPTEHLHALQADGVAVRPGPEALVHAQDKGVMRARLAELGVPCPRNATW